MGPGGVAMRSSAAAAAAFAAVLLLAPGPAADAGDGFVARQPLRVVSAGGEPDAQGGFESTLRVTNGRRVLQSFTVWFRGLSLAEGATLWMARPGDAELESVASFAVAENGSGVWSVRIDSSLGTNPELPLGVETVLELVRAPIEVRVPGGGLDDVPVLRGRIGNYRFRDVRSGKGEGGTRSRRTPLRLPPEPVPVVDDGASGQVRVWRQRRRGDLADLHQGLTVFATGLTEDDVYEVWLEDASGVLVEIGEMESTEDGLAFFSLDTRMDDDLPSEADVETVRDLSGRRLEIRRSGFDDPSLVALLRRIR